MTSGADAPAASPDDGAATGAPAVLPEHLTQALDFVLESAAMGYWDLDLVADLTERSLAHDQCFGYQSLLPQWTYQTFLAHVHAQDRDRVATAFEAALAGDGNYHVEFRTVWPDGEVHWLLSRGRFLHDADHRPVRVAGIVADVTAAKRAERAALEASERFVTLFDSMADAVLTTDLSGTITSWNAAAEQLFGWTAAEAVGRDAAIIVPPDRHHELTDRLAVVRRNQSIREYDTVRVRKDGTTVEVSVTACPRRDADGSLVEATAILRDITERRRMQRELQHQATVDALTGLPNRALLTHQLDQAVAGRHDGSPTSVLVLDLDGFKVVNDAAGHVVGDLLLVETARRLESALRAHDSVARLGGDEFVVVCRDTGAAEAQAVARRLHDVIAPAMVVDGQRHHVTTSVGIAVSPPLDPDRLMRCADVAMYEAKAAGPGRTRLFEEAMSDRVRERLELSHALRDALAAGDLALHYQPVVDLTTGALAGVEALARWTRDGVPVPPSVFVVVAEQTGLITAMDRWAIGEACRGGAELAGRGLLGDHGHVAVNVGARDIGEGLVTTMVADAVAAAPGMHPERLVVEITETALMGDPDAVAGVLQDLADLGVGAALDDFGTGFSSLTHLQRLPIAVLKIDASFVRQITTDPRHLAIARSVVELAAQLGIRTVAEGVETREQLHLLQHLGCLSAQGWLWSKALPLPELASRVEGLPGRRFDVS